MFDVGFAELFLLSIIGLLVLGPERLPAVARTLGGMVRKARTSWYSLKRTVEAELAAAEAAAPIKEAGEEIKNLSRQVSEAARDPLGKALSGPPTNGNDGNPEPGSTDPDTGAGPDPKPDADQRPAD